MWELIGIVGAVMILIAAITQFTPLAAITQMGSIQERSMPWTHLSKPKQHVASIFSKIAPALSPRAGTPPTTPKEAVDHVKTMDKIVYTFSVANVVFTAYFLGACPQYFYLWHTPKALIYIAHRYFSFRKQKDHYLMFDFCYWANALVLVYVWVLPDSPLLFQIVYTVANGPLAWAVLAFTNSLIFHSAPHLTSAFIHISPMLLVYALRWFPSDFKVCDNWPECDEVSPFSMITYTITNFYVHWIIFYYVWVFMILGKRARDRGYKTLFDYVTGQKGPARFITKVSNNVWVQRLAYMGVHFLFATSTMLLGTVFFKSFAANLFFIFAICSTSAWNASRFYFTVFLAKYEMEAKKRSGFEDAAEESGSSSTPAAGTQAKSE